MLLYDLSTFSLRSNYNFWKLLPYIQYQSWIYYSPNGIVFLLVCIHHQIQNTESLIGLEAFKYLNQELIDRICFITFYAVIRREYSTNQLSVFVKSGRARKQAVLSSIQTNKNSCPIMLYVKSRSPWHIPPLDALVPKKPENREIQEASGPKEVG